MRRTFAWLLALGLVLATAGPATAARKDKPPGPAEFEVTMSFVDDEGLATTCGSGDPITMTGNLDGGVLRADGARLDTNIPISSYELWGCHGGPARVVVPDGATPPEVFSGALWLDFGPGDTVTLQWRFDYYWEFEQNLKNGKLTQKALELFALTSTPMPFDGTGTQIVEGDFTLRRFTKVDSARGVWKDLGTATSVSFQLTITPKP